MRAHATKLITVKVPAPVASGLQALARRTGKRQSQLIREGLELRLRAEGAAGVGSVLELAGDVVGSLEGPVDLGTNPRHLRGFGT